MEEDKKKEEETIGDGLYLQKGHLSFRISEVKGGRLRDSGYCSLITRHRHFYGNEMKEWMRQYVKDSEGFVLPNEFLT